MSNTEYLVTFRYINSGNEAHEVISVPAWDDRPVEEVVAESWRGLTCSTGGLRDIIKIDKM